MFFKVNLLDKRLEQTVCDTLSFAGFSLLEDDDLSVPMICDEVTASISSGFLNLVILCRDQSFFESEKFEEIRKNHCVLPLSVPFNFADLVEAVFKLQPEGAPLFPVSRIFRKETENTEEESPRSNQIIPKIDLTSRRIEIDGKTVYLSDMEMALFSYLYTNRAKIISREDILKNVWRKDVGSNIVDVYVTYLRKKLCKIAPPGILVSVRGKGYILNL